MRATDNSGRRTARDIAESIIGSLAATSSPAVSPDGRYVASVVSRVDLQANRTRTSIWIAPADGSSPARPLTAGAPAESRPTWSPCGRFLAFVSRRDAPSTGPLTPSSLHVLPVDGPGEVRTVATLPEGVDALRWSPDGRWLAFVSRTPDERYSAESEAWQSPRRIETFFTRLDGVGWTVDRPSHVHVVDAEGLGAVRNLTPGPSQHSGLSWLADSSGVVTSAARHEGWDLDLATDLYLVPLTGDIVRLTDGAGSLGHPSVSPDGTRVAFLGLDDPLTQPQNVRVGVLDLATRERRWVSTGLDRTFEVTSGTVDPVWIDDDTILASAEDRGTCHVQSVAADGSRPPAPITAGRRWIRGFDAAAGLLALCVSDVTHPTELVVRSLDALLDDQTAETRLTTVGAALLAAAPPAAWQHVLVPSSDGTLEIDAWVMPPVGLVVGDRHPVILNVHGGPHTQYGETYFDEMQMQAAAGFVVVLCNPRGSSGREQSFGQAILGPKHPVAPGSGWGGLDVDDVMAVLDTVLERFDFCDPDRVGMQGGSYGGYMATELAGRFSDRFRGICSERSVNNMLSEEWSSDIATIFRVEHGPDHVSDPDEYTRMSPIRLVRDIRVPMLLIHSEDDLRCPISQAEELFVALRTLGRDVVLYRFPAEGHELSRSGSPVHRVQRAEIILDWFRERLA
jgi:dipeptidyl aminopeptidase/acylaminoacyl peptidase